MTILIIDNFLDPKYSKYFSRYCTEDIEIFFAPRGEFPDDLKRYHHIILSGSEESILNERDWIAKEMKFVQDIKRLGIPTLGICFGHQLIAKALLGEKGVRRVNTPEIGWKEVTVQQNDPLFSKVDKKFFVFNSHFDEAYELGDDFKVLAKTDLCEASAFKVKEAPMWGIQFHPEISMEDGKKFIRDIQHLAPDLDLEREIQYAKDSGISKTLFDTFYGL